MADLWRINTLCKVYGSCNRTLCHVLVGAEMHELAALRDDVASLCPDRAVHYASACHVGCPIINVVRSVLIAAQIRRVPVA